MNKSRQTGLGLLDALISVGVLAAGVLVLMAAVNQSQVNTRELRGSQIATLLTQDLAARLHISQSAFVTNIAPKYSHGFDDELPEAPDCSGDESCDADKVVDHDLATWGKTVARDLPSGQFAIMASSTDGSLLAVMLAWQAPGVAQPITPDSGLTALVCPATFSCLLSHIRP